jgi:hypothetical protein
LKDTHVGKVEGAENLPPTVFIRMREALSLLRALASAICTAAFPIYVVGFVGAPARYTSRFISPLTVPKLLPSSHTDSPSFT